MTTKQTDNQEEPVPKEISQAHEPQASLLLFPFGTLSEADKERLAAHGMVCVEVADPKAVIQLQPTKLLVSTNVSGDDLVRCALEAIASQAPYDSNGFINGAGRIAHKFVSLLAASTKAHP